MELDLITTKDAARILDTSEQTVRNLANSGTLKVLRAGSGLRLYQRKDVEKLKLVREKKRAS